ncbi:MAG TPA: sialidase family protein, partial [Acidimicrobiales bacterium]|nr:sialidase family protein [Acidimicrobiales bacterium]
MNMGRRPGAGRLFVTTIAVATMTAGGLVTLASSVQAAPPPPRTSGSHAPTSPRTGSQPPNDANGELNAVSCTSATSCLAVGSYGTIAGAFDPITERWDGTKWVLASSPVAPPSFSLSLADLACTSPTSCMAAGQGPGSLGASTSVAEHWNGSTWALSNVVQPPSSSSSLSAIACPSATFCMVVGGYSLTSGFFPDAETWNGASWKMTTLAVPPGQSADQLNLTDVACGAASSCTAVGYDSPTSGATVPLAEHWNGAKWSVVTLPGPAGATFTGLFSVSCPSATLCMAVGSSSSPTSSSNLAEMWNGKTWATTASMGNTEFISDVECASTTSCLAVGSGFGAGSDSGAESWNGRSWTAVPAPVPADGFNDGFTSVSCVSVSSCVAVGSYFLLGSGRLTALGDEWNGSRFKLIPPIDPTSPVTVLSPGIDLLSKTCPSSSAEIEQAVDPKNGYIYEDWIGCQIGDIAFVRSTDGGKTFSTPILFGSGSINSWDPAVAVAADGTVYASFMESLGGHSYPVVEVSFDHGATFSVESKLIPTQAGNWGDRDFIAAGANGTVYLTWDYGPS